MKPGPGLFSGEDGVFTIVNERWGGPAEKPAEKGVNGAKSGNAK